jgi:hypothetical protein
MIVICNKAQADEGRATKTNQCALIRAKPSEFATSGSAMLPLPVAVDRRFEPGHQSSGKFFHLTR